MRQVVMLAAFLYFPQFHLCSLPVKGLEFVPAEGAIEPQVRQFFLDAVRSEAVVQVLEIDEIEVLILVEA